MNQILLENGTSVTFLLVFILNSDEMLCGLNKKERRFRCYYI